MDLAETVFLGIVLAVCAGAALYTAVETNALRTRGVVTEATVIDLDYRGRGGQVMQVRFTADGREVTGSRDDYEYRSIGDPLEVLYDPDKPTNFVKVEWGADYFATGMWGAAAGAAGVMLTREALTTRRPGRT